MTPMDPHSHGVRLLGNIHMHPEQLGTRPRQIHLPLHSCTKQTARMGTPRYIPCSTTDPTLWDKPFTTHMGRCNWHLSPGHGRSLKWLIGSVVCMVLLLFHRDTAPLCLWDLSICRYYNQRLGAGRPLGPSPPFPPSHGPACLHPNISGQHRI